MTLDEIKSELTKLTDEEREEVMDFLNASIDGKNSDDELEEPDPEWIDEINRRVAAIESGQAKTSPLSEAMARINKRFE